MVVEVVVVVGSRVYGHVDRQKFFDNNKIEHAYRI